MKVIQYDQYVWVIPYATKTEDHGIRIEVKPSSVALYDVGEVIEMYPEHWQTLIEAMQTAAKIQRMLAAGEPVIIKDGQLVEIPKTTYQWWALGVIANNESYTDDGYDILSTFDMHYHLVEWEHHHPLGYGTESFKVFRDDAINPLFKMGLICADGSHHALTDLGWQVLKESK